MEIKKEEIRNFSSAEIDLLLNLIEKYKEVLEKKKNDAVTNQKKKDCWLKLAGEFNREAIGYYRSSKTLRTKYYNLKKGYKKMAAEKKRKLYATGGGSPTKKQITDKGDKFFAVSTNHDCNNLECDGPSSSSAIKNKWIGKKIEKELEYMATEHKLKVEILELEKKERQLRIKEIELRIQQK